MDFLEYIEPFKKRRCNTLIEWQEQFERAFNSYWELNQEQRDEIDELLSYGAKEGYISPDDIKEMDYDERYDYYLKCQSI